MATVFITCPYPLSRLTGIGRFVRDLIRFLEPLGISASLACPAEFKSQSIRGDGGFNLRWKVFSNLELAIATAMKQVRERDDFQVVHVHQAHLQSLAATLTARILGKASLITVHVRTPVAAGRIRRATERLISNLSVRSATESVAVSRFVAETFPYREIRIIENGVDTEMFRSSAEGRRRVRTDLGLGPETVFVFAGRWTTTKGVDTLIRAANSSLLASLAFKILLLGEATPDEPDLVARSVEMLDNPSRIIPLGPIGGGLPDYLSAGEVFVSPSLYEGMPLAFLEAMATGLPVLASDIPIHRELVNRAGVGWLFPPGNAEELAARMAQVIKKGIPMDWSERARSMVVAHHDVRSKVAEYVSLYRSMIHP